MYVCMYVCIGLVVVGRYCLLANDIFFYVNLRVAGTDVCVNHHQISIPRYQLSAYGRQAFSVAGLTVWNSLPEDIQDPECSADSH